MTEMRDSGVIPPTYTGLRMRMALEYAKIPAGDMAEFLEVNPTTLSRWLNGHSPVKRSTLRLWAMRTGVSFHWLDTGMAPQLEPGQSVRHQGLEPRTRWFAVEAVAA